MSTKLPETSDANDWSALTMQRIGRLIARQRSEAKMSLQKLSDQCTALGYPVARNTLWKIEQGSKATVSIQELLVVATALGTSPGSLIFNLWQDAPVEVLPGKFEPSTKALGWLGLNAGLYKPGKNNYIFGSTTERVDGIEFELCLSETWRQLKYLDAQLDDITTKVIALAGQIQGSGDRYLTMKNLEGRAPNPHAYGSTELVIKDGYLALKPSVELQSLIQMAHGCVEAWVLSCDEAFIRGMPFPFPINHLELIDEVADWQQRELIHGDAVRDIRKAAEVAALRISNMPWLNA